MTRRSKRELTREVESLHSSEHRTNFGAIELKNGEYVNFDGDPITDWENVVFAIPYALWREWETLPEVWDFDPEK
jgi:hypothetical protein